MSEAKRTRITVPDPYTCICGTVITHKRKSLKKHLLTKAHLSTPAPAPTCPPHHWVIESANGHLSNGYCQKCNKKDAFENSIGAYTWGGRAQREYENDERGKKEDNSVEQLVNSDT
jgi:hypothetical protein